MNEYATAPGAKSPAAGATAGCPPVHMDAIHVRKWPYRIEPSLISSEGQYMYISNPRASHPTLSNCLRIEVDSWRQLAPGNSVVLLTSDRRNPRIAGRVDEISVDGHYLWLIQDNGAGRRLFHRPEGYTTFLDSEE
nr:hypothetical protein GCM10017547_20380 [Pseudarthrobacter oxydans]